LLLTAGPYGNIIRVLSPLTISDIDLKTGLDILADSVREAGQVQGEMAG
jgi:4-aminobutyrate aminotransferase/(S)-3-amino-2-methylpropionate transaminase